jgi:hypothetical protein
MHSEKHLTDNLNELQKDYEHQKKLQAGYRQQLRILSSVDVDSKLRLEHQIKESQSILDKLDLEIISLNQKIDGSKNDNQNNDEYKNSDKEQEKISIRVSLDNNSYQVESDGYEFENTRNKAYASLQKIRSNQKIDSRVPDGLKDDNRKIYKKGKYGEQTLLKDDDLIFAGDILESRPDAIKG